jgi:CBS domain containing-hemolysin-like protein
MTLEALSALHLDVRDVFMVLFCLALGAFFQVAETGLLTVADARIQDLVNEGERDKHRFKRLLRLWIEKPDHVLTAIVVGKHAAQVALVLGVAVLLATQGPERLLTPWAAVAVGGVVLAAIVAVELIARAFAKEKAELAVAVAFPVVLAAWACTLPLVMLFTRLSRLSSRIFGGSATRSGPFVTERDLVAMIALGRKTGAIDKVEGRMLTSIIELGDTLVREVMVARADISSLPIDATWEDVMQEVREEGHSRIPVYSGSIDDVRGFFHTKDLLTGEIKREDFSLLKHLRPVEFVPELGKVSDLLRTFQRKKTHLAVVVDEFGGTAGIVALEDVLEEIVGPIQDEHDEETAEITRLSDTLYVAEGKASLYDLGEALGITFPDGGYDTLAGFLIARAGRMPQQGDRLGYQGYLFAVAEADERRVSRVDIERTSSGSTVAPMDADSGPIDARNGAIQALPPDHP